MRHQVVRPSAPAGEGRELPGAALLPPRPLSSQCGTRSVGALQPPLRPGRAGFPIGCGSCQSWRGPMGTGTAGSRGGRAAGRAGAHLLPAVRTVRAGGRCGLLPAVPRAAPSEALRAFFPACQSNAAVRLVVYRPLCLI